MTSCRTFLEQVSLKYIFQLLWAKDFKVALSFLINWISLNKLFFKKLAYICYNKCLLWRNLCWVWKKTNNTTLVFLLSNCKYMKSFMTVLLLGYRIEFSYLYIPQAYYFISSLWLWSTDEYVLFFILSKSPPLIVQTYSYALFSMSLLKFALELYYMGEI